METVTLSKINPTPAVLRTALQLDQAGLIKHEEIEALERVGERYSVAIPAGVVALMDPNDPEDPIAKQFVPDTAELDALDNELADPIGDHDHSPLPGLIHRYPDRVLLMPTLSCPVYCRYCFRRDRVGRNAAAPSSTDIDSAIAYIKDRKDIHEVILTGGDPLSLSDTRLGALLAQLSAVPHLNNLRIHTRVPVSLPSRVTDRLIKALRCDLPVWMVLHVNHSRELTTEVANTCERLTRGGIPLLSQSVLLKGVNADIETLSELFRRLIALKVKPYYLHHPDQAQGTARFRLSLEEGRAIFDALRGHLSGLCQPTYVVDIPEGYGKVAAQTAAIEQSDQEWRMKDFKGEIHRYEEI
ncbi:MAG: L-lysine 2,3-aminomutase [Alphaproteobacteria bacterium MarineAlpha11_Bin1]|nr:MAG: L-lysine 2,3-aminomutase [Alphaproteobacteria bacterium MarineAlpha11_Bin1]|tara:strand:- start:1727 stop:2794 length:1068 start_codon:yes stop_codon:yes gene_type:complete